MIDHGREFVGPLYIQEVIGLPTYDASFAKRLVYNTLDNKVYIGKVNIGWSVVGEGLGFGSSGTSGTSGKDGQISWWFD